MQPAPFRPRRLRPALVGCCLACCVAMAGCKLVDQRSFDAAAGRKPVPHLPPGPPPPPPPVLATVRFGAPPESWRPELEAIVRQALARKPEALFRIETLVPAQGAPAAQAAAVAAAGQTGGETVADAVVEAGASSAQLELTAAADPSLRRPEVRVYVK